MKTRFYKENFPEEIADGGLYFFGQIFSGHGKAEDELEAGVTCYNGLTIRFSVMGRCFSCDPLDVLVQVTGIDKKLS